MRAPAWDIKEIMTKSASGKLELTTEELEFKELDRSTYNSGKMREAYELAEDFYRRNPGSVFGKFAYAGMAGDYSDDLSLTSEKRKELLDTAKKLIKEVYEDERAMRYDFYAHVRNEYFWFHQLHEQQYALGEELVAKGALRGYYSMCVGASAMARKCLLEKNEPESATMWADRSVKAFHEFEKVDPDWYNINYFYAYALAVLGNYDAAAAVFKDMYRKQKAAVKEKEVTEFMANVDKIRLRRTAK